MADGDIVAAGVVSVDWIIREYTIDGKLKYDWSADNVNGGYSESDLYYDSIDDAKEDLGVE